jgi:hypothetical protein
MNNEPPFNDDLMEHTAEFDTETLDQLRRAAGVTLLIALGVGLATAALMHAFRPAMTPRRRMARLVGDMEDSLREISAPTMHKVGAMATDGAHALGQRFSHGEAKVEKFLRGAAKRLHRMTSAF